MSKYHKYHKSKSAPENDIIWGATEIGRIINRTPSQVYHLLNIGALGDAARKLSHKIIIGSRRKLEQLASGPDQAA